MRTRIAAFVGAFALAGSLVLAAAGTAAAVGPAVGPAGRGVCATQATAAFKTPTVDTLRAFGDCEIGRRMTTLTNLTSRISSSKVLTSSDASALSAEISSTSAGLTSLKATIDSETNLAALKADVTRIATEFRVYLLVVPQVNLVSAADGVFATQARFATINTNLSARIATAKAAGKDTSAAQAALDAMNTQVANAVALATGLPARLLPLTPAEYNAGTAGPVITSARTALVQARSDLKAALVDARNCRAALKALA
jgi:hypothetical protein